MKRVLAALSALGLVIAAAAVILGNQPPTVKSSSGAVPQAPFDAWVAGSGTLEASTQNVALGCSVGGIVSDVFVTWGDRVSPGQALFSIDDRDLEARLVTARAGLKVAMAALEKARHSLEFVRTLEESVSKRELVSRRDDVTIDEANL